MAEEYKPRKPLKPNKPVKYFTLKQPVTPDRFNRKVGRGTLSIQLYIEPRLVHFVEFLSQELCVSRNTVIQFILARQMKIYEKLMKTKGYGPFWVPFEDDRISFEESLREFEADRVRASLLRPKSIVQHREKGLESLPLLNLKSQQLASATDLEEVKEELKDFSSLKEKFLNRNRAQVDTTEQLPSTKGRLKKKKS
jgi:hypothetical protein